MQPTRIPKIEGNLRSFMLTVPEEIYACSGIIVFGKRIKSVLFSTDVSIIRNTNADAVIAVYPFTPQPIITQAVMSVADVPVFSGIGGGLTQGERVVDLAIHAEHQGAMGVVVNSPTQNEVISKIRQHVDIPVIVTVVSEADDIDARLKAGANILNVSAADKTVELVRNIRKDYHDIAIMATGGPSGDTITKTIEAGANAITWTPPSSGEVFKQVMANYRKGLGHP